MSEPRLYTYRVEVEPSEAYHMSKDDPARKSKRNYSRAEDLKREILRHCDDVGHVYIVTDSVTCGLCGWEWEVEEDGNDECPKGMPLCCDAAQAWFTETQAAKEPTHD